MPLTPKKVKSRKVKKVLKEFEEGKLRSGSKKGPKVVSKKQALAIALNESSNLSKRGKKK